MPASNRPIAIRRIVGVVFTLTVGGLCVFWSIDAARRHREFAAWQTAEPTRFTVDLSKPGTVSGPFQQTCQAAHGQLIVLQVTDLPTDPEELLKGLKGKGELVSASGNVEETFVLPAAHGRSGKAGEIPLVYFHPVEKGAYTLRLVIDEPATGLAGKPQVVSARYEMCGLEQLPAVIEMVFAVASGVLALTVGGFTSVGLAMHGWRARDTSTGGGSTTTG